MGNLWIEDKSCDNHRQYSFWSYASGAAPAPELFTGRLFYDKPPKLIELSWEKVEKMESEGKIKVFMHANGVATGTLQFASKEDFQEAVSK